MLITKEHIEVLEILRNCHINDTCYGKRISVILTEVIQALQEKAGREAKP